MQNILVTGANGQLGSEMRYLSSDLDFRLYFTDVADLDITDFDKADSFVRENRIDFIVNCAAYTNVDKAETDTAVARLINVTGVESLANAALRNGATLIHISTDYVFDGRGTRPMREDDPTAPQGAYGMTKLEGEHAMRATGCKGIIIRTAWLYSTFGSNFVKTMLRLGSERDTINVVADQRGTPTYARDLAKAILHIIPQLSTEPRHGDIYHYSGDGECTWYDFAKRIMELSGKSCIVNPISSDQYPTPTPRPAYSVLDKTRIKKDFGVNIPSWEEALEEYFRN